MFFSFSKQKPLFGLDIGSSAIKLVQLRETKNGFALERFGVKALDPEMIVDGTVMDAGRVGELLRELLNEQKVKIKEVAIAISGHSVIVKKITVPAMSEDELEESIKWEAEQYIPFDINDVNIDFHVLGAVDGPDGQPQMNVLLIAAKKDKLTEYTSLVTEAGLTPMVVDVDAFTIENMFCINYDIQENEVVALVNIGASVMNINILKGGTSAFTRDITVGGNRFTETLQKELNIGYQEAENAKMAENPADVNPETVAAVISAVNNEVAGEITRSIDYFRSTAGSENLDRVYLCGGASKTRGLVQLVGERLGVSVELINPFNKIEVDPKLIAPEQLQEIAPQAAVGVGLAFRKVGDR